VIKISVCVFAAGLLLATGCGSDEKKDGDKSAAKGKAGSGGAVASEAQSLALGSLTIDVATPKGWSKAELGATAVTFSKPGGMFPSVMTVSATCQGSCDDIGKNLDGFVDMQADMQKQMGYAVEVMNKSDDGRAFELSLDQGGDKTHQIYVHRFEDGWTEAASCTISLLKEDVGNASDYRKLCEAMTATPKK
jgi:hypothetical protein